MINSSTARGNWTDDHHHVRALTKYIRPPTPHRSPSVRTHSNPCMSNPPPQSQSQQAKSKPISSFDMCLNRLTALLQASDTHTCTCSGSGSGLKWSEFQSWYMSHDDIKKTKKQFQPCDLLPTVSDDKYSRLLHIFTMILSAEQRQKFVINYNRMVDYLLPTLITSTTSSSSSSSSSSTTTTTKTTTTTTTTTTHMQQTTQQQEQDQQQQTNDISNHQHVHGVPISDTPTYISTVNINKSLTANNNNMDTTIIYSAQDICSINQAPVVKTRFARSCAHDISCYPPSSHSCLLSLQMINDDSNNNIYQQSPYRKEYQQLYHIKTKQLPNTEKTISTGLRIEKALPDTHMHVPPRFVLYNDCSSHLNVFESVSSPQVLLSSLIFLNSNDIHSLEQASHRAKQFITKNKINEIVWLIQMTNEFDELIQYKYQEQNQSVPSPFEMFSCHELNWFEIFRIMQKNSNLHWSEKEYGECPWCKNPIDEKMLTCVDTHWSTSEYYVTCTTCDVYIRQLYICETDDCESLTQTRCLSCNAWACSECLQSCAVCDEEGCKSCFSKCKYCGYMCHQHITQGRGGQSMCQECGIVDD